MIISDAGVTGDSFMDFTIPTDFAKNNLYYIPQYGHFFCNELYRVERRSLGWFLIAYIQSGSLYLENGSIHTVAHTGDLALLDCRSPHCYYCKDETDFFWFHFCGAGSAAYTELLYEQSDIIFPISDEERRDLHNIFSCVMQEPANEHMVSAGIHQLLGHLASSENEGGWYRPLLPAINFIQSHYNDQVQTHELAAMCSMSVSYLTKCFHRYLGRTPHEYLLAWRLHKSKQMLISSDLTIEEIAEQCGFNSASHFARAFRASNNMSPTDFRQNILPFRHNGQTGDT